MENAFQDIESMHVIHSDYGDFNRCDCTKPKMIIFEEFIYHENNEQRIKDTIKISDQECELKVIVGQM